jgi:hypothetical protein
MRPEAPMDANLFSSCRPQLARPCIPLRALCLPLLRPLCRPLCRLLCCWGLLWPATVPAQQVEESDAIVTDRPDFVESSDVVGKGRVQLETSIAIDRDRHEGVKERTTSTPTLLRVGVADTLELRLETDGRLRYRADGAGGPLRQRGWADTAIGIKWHARDEGEGGPSIGFLLHADLASGSTAFRGSGVRPSLRMAAEWEFGDGIGLGVMPGLVRDRTPDGSHAVNGIFAVVLGKSWSDRFRTFVEVAMPQIAHARHGGTQATFDVGASWLLSPRWQVDAMLVRGLNDRTADLSFTAGLSYKY